MQHAHNVLPSGAWSGEPADTVVLDYDERYRRRVAMTGVRGLEFLLDLAEAVMLRAGDGLKLDDGRIVEVVAAPESLVEIRAADAAALTRIAWHLGNRHLPTELLRKSLRIRRDSVIEDMARGLGGSVVAIEAPFNPEGGAYVRALAQAHDHHGHDHGHDHHDRAHDHHGHDHGHHDHAHDHGRR
ncbi:MAG TPA: urease accessory protein UreE [Roseiarcus sp.]